MSVVRGDTEAWFVSVIYYLCNLETGLDKGVSMGKLNQRIREIFYLCKQYTVVNNIMMLSEIWHTNVPCSTHQQLPTKKRNKRINFLNTHKRQTFLRLANWSFTSTRIIGNNRHEGKNNFARVLWENILTVCCILNLPGQCYGSPLTRTHQTHLVGCLEPFHSILQNKAVCWLLFSFILRISLILNRK